MTMEQRLGKARTRLLLDHAFFGTLALRMIIVKDDRIPTASTDGVRIRFNPTFFDTLTDDEVMGVLAHEVMHVAHGHVWRRSGRDAERWNVAADYAINHILVQSGMTLPKGCLLDAAYQDAAEQIYGRLPKPQPSGGAGQKGRPGGGENRVGSPGLGSGVPTPQDPSANPAQPKEGGLPGASAAPGTPVSDPGGCGAVEDAPEGTDTKALEADWKVAIGQAAMAARGQGRLPADLERLVDEILNPKVAWEVLLRDFVERTAKNDYSWSCPNRRYLGSGIILPSLVSDELPVIVLAIDTSGSIGPDELNQFAAEVSAVLGAYETTIHLVWCDASVQKTETLTRADLPLKLTPHGGGGTDFRPVFDWVQKEGIEPAALIYLTDMFGSFPDKDPGYPVLWVATTKGHKAPFGDVVEM